MSELVEGTLRTPEGEVVVPTFRLTDEDAALLRAYKKFLKRHELREALFCNSCALATDVGEAYHGQPHGCEAHVTDTDILIKCRCRNRFHRGQSF